jgi:glutamate-1-semialdehyde 2,1-aminomutase
LLQGLAPAGVPRNLQGTALPFRYNHIEELESIVSQYGETIAAVVMEPLRDHAPAPGFLENVRKITERIRAVLIIDEISAGFRLETGGAHLVFGLEPDIAVFAKAISNGYPMAAVIGKAGVMQAAQDTFISSTYWTDRIGPAAALATVRKHRRERVAEHLIRIGTAVQSGWREAAVKAGIQVEIGGIPPLGHFTIMGKKSRAAHTLFTQLMLERGFLAARAFYATFSHQDSHINGYLSALSKVFPMIADALNNNQILEMLKGPVAHAGFQRIT